MNIVDFLKNNFWHVFPILVCAAFAFAVVLDRMRALFQAYAMKDSRRFLEEIKRSVLNGNINEAMAHCEREGDKPLAKMTKEALLRAHLPEEIIDQALEIEYSEAVNAIQKRTAFLSTIANVTTLLGLLGTIAGLIASFEAVGQADPQQKSALLAQGISTAMNATMLGLGVAIPCMLAFSALMNRSQKLIHELEDGALRIRDVMRLRLYSQPKSMDEKRAV